MGFNTALLIVSPSRHYRAPPDCILWRVSEVLNFGYSWRDLPKLTTSQMTYISDRHETKGRAGVVTFSWMYPRLCERLRSAKKGDVFAPPFVAIPEDMRLKNVFFPYREEQLSALAPRSERILPFDQGSILFPDLWHMQKHNEALANLTDEWERRRSHHVIIDLPLVWIPCKVVAEWIDELLKDGGEKRQLRFDREARVRVEGWLGQLQAYAKIHARVLFVFEPITWP